jgi:hypothetical protein
MTGSASTGDRRKHMAYGRRPARTWGGVLPALLVIWLVIGAIAAGQRHYYSGSGENCAKAGTTAVTILAGPLNYVGINPKISCSVPQPSK